MNVQHLRYAVEVERAGSITDAADNLYISQPSLSRAIRELESSVGFPIFERTTRGMIPTQKGKQLLSHAYEIVKQLSEIESLSQNAEKHQQVLSLCMPPSGYIAEAVSRFFTELDARMPLNLHVQEAENNEILDRVAGGVFRMGIIRYPMSEESRYLNALHKRGMKSEAVWEFEPIALMSAENPLASAELLTVGDLVDLVEVTALENSEPRTPGQVSEKIVVLFERALRLEFLSDVTSSYMWSAPQPETILQRYHLIQKRVDRPDARMCDRLIYTIDYRFSAGERAFISRLFEVKNQVAFGA